MTDPVLAVLYIITFPGFFFLTAYSLLFEYIDRKIVARMQARVGPPLYQPLADLIKMLGKEVIDPSGVDRVVFDAAPIIALAAVMTAFLYIPIVADSPFAFQGDLVVILYLLSIPTMALFLIGWLSRNIYAAVGGIRAVTQLFIYEVPFFLVLLTPALMAGTWSLSEIARWQQGHAWFALLQPIAFIVALVCLQAKVERTPFDIPEADTELVAGPWTELTGRRLAVMHLAFDVYLVVGCALVAAVFLGGPFLPWTFVPAWIRWGAGFFVFLVKTLALLVVLSAFKAATGRIRIDQLNRIGWKYLTGAALLQVALVLAMNALQVIA